MKLATYRDGSRDGQLIVVANDLSAAHFASGIATRLQQVLDDWNFMSPQLEELARTLNHGKARHAFPFEPGMCMAPLPRAYQRVDAAACLSHVQPQPPTRSTEIHANDCSEPAMYQCDSDDLLGACDDVVCINEDHGIDFEAGLAVITGDVALGCSPEAGIDAVRLLMLANAVTLRHLAAREQAKGFGFVQSKPTTAFSPVAVTPEELGDAWRGGKVHLTLESRWNGKRLGRCDAAADMPFHFGQLIAHLCKTRRLRAGSIVGGGTVRNQDSSQGFSCIAEQRTIETVESGEARTGYLKFGDSVRITMDGADGQSVCGAIEQRVVAPATR